MWHQNPLSDKRRFYLEQAYSPQYGLDEASLEDLTEIEIEARRAKLNQLLDWLAETDPTDSGKYAVWIAKLYKRDLIQFPEDIEKIRERLQQFEQKKHLLPIPKRDINAYKTYGELARTLDEYGGIGVREAERLATAEGQEVILEEGPYRVIKATTQEATSQLARHTEWCVKDPRWGRGYLEWGPLYFIDKLAGFSGEPVYQRHALAYKGNCDLREAQYEKFKRFVESCRQQQVCFFCLKPYPSECDEAHLIDAEEFDRAYVNFREYNSFFNKETIVGENDGINIPSHLIDYISDTECRDFYSVLNEYDEELSPQEHAGIKPILLKIFEPDFSGGREILKQYYQQILAGSRDALVEQNLISIENPDKILDYLESLNTKSRWPEIEHLVFKKAATAARYYTILQNVLKRKDKEELANLAQEIPQSQKPEMVDLPKEYTGDIEYLTGRHYRQKKRYRERINQLQDRIKLADKKYQKGIDKIKARQDSQFQKLQRAIEKAIDDAEKGISIEGIVQQLIHAGNQYYGAWGESFYEDVEHPLTQFIIDFIGHYNKGFIIADKRKRVKVRRQKGSRKGVKRIIREPHLFSGEYYVTHSNRILPKKKAIRRQQRETKIRKKQEQLVRLVEQLTRRNPLPNRRGYRHSTRRKLNRAIRDYQDTTVSSARGIQSAIWRWMREYGLSWDRGFTFIEQDSFVREQLRNMTEDGKSRDFQDAVVTYGLNAPFIILCSGSYYDDLYAILNGGVTSIFFDRLGKKYFKNDPKQVEKLRLISRELQRELLALLAKKGWQIADSLPHPVTIEKKSGYRHQEYWAYPMYPKFYTRRKFNSLIPFYR